MHKRGCERATEAEWFTQRWGQLPRLRPGMPFDQLPDPDTDVAEAAIVSIEAAQLRRRMRRLPRLERMVLAWRYGIGAELLGYRQIAERLGMPQGSIWKIEQRALEMLRTAYGFEEAA